MMFNEELPHNEGTGQYLREYNPRQIALAREVFSNEAENLIMRRWTNEGYSRAFREIFNKMKENGKKVDLKEITIERLKEYIKNNPSVVPKPEEFV